MRLGELHGAHPFAADELVQIGALECLAAVGVERIDRRHSQHRAVGEGDRSRMPHFGAGGIDDLRQALTAPFRRGGHRVPATQTPIAISLLPAGRRRHLAVAKARAERVADAIERRDDFSRKPPRFADNRVNVVEAKLAEQTLFDRRRKRCGVFERRADLGKRSAVGHLRSPTVTPGGALIPSGTKKSGASGSFGSTR